MRAQRRPGHPKTCAGPPRGTRYDRTVKDASTQGRALRESEDVTWEQAHLVHLYSMVEEVMHRLKVKAFLYLRVWTNHDIQHAQNAWQKVCESHEGSNYRRISSIFLSPRRSGDKSLDYYLIVHENLYTQTPRLLQLDKKGHN